MVIINFTEMVDNVQIKGCFDSTCKLMISHDSLDSVKSGKLKIRITNFGKQEIISRFNLTICSTSGFIDIYVGNDNAEVLLEEETSGAYDLRLWRKSKINIGNKTTLNGIKIICDNSEFICGKDCMFSDDILIQTNDQHGIVDLESGSIINDNYKAVLLGNHVWLGRKSILIGNLRIGSGAIVGAASIVTKDIPEKVIVVGNPARIVKENYTWSRSPSSLDYFSQTYILNTQ